MIDFITLRGRPGAGKTTLAGMLAEGKTSLIQVPLLQEAVRRGCGVWTEHTLESHAISDALGSLCGDKQCLVDDNMAPLHEVAELDENMRVYVVVLVSRPWVRAGRIAVRFQYHSPDEEQAVAALTNDGKNIVEHFCDSELPPQIQLVWVDTSDYPVREISEDEARRVVCGETPARPVLPQNECYHPTMFVRGELWGSAAPAAVSLARTRLDSILPADLTGKTVLDIGGAFGMLSWEAMHRAASYVTLVERDPRCTAFARQMRDAEALPVSVSEVDIERETLPLLSVHGRPLRYNLALLLNVLHHCLDPVAAFANVLATCDACIVETPFCQGTVPRFVDDTTYPQKPCIPPWWIEEQAKANGFVVTSMENSLMHEGYRLIMRLQR